MIGSHEFKKGASIGLRMQQNLRGTPWEFAATGTADLAYSGRQKRWEEDLLGELRSELCETKRKELSSQVQPQHHYRL